MGVYDLVTPFPKRTFTMDDGSIDLKSTGQGRQCLFHLQERLIWGFSVSDFV